MKHCILILISLLLFGCTNSRKKHPIVIGFSQCISSDAWRNEMNNEIFTEAGLILSHDVQIVYRDAHENTALQISQIRGLIEQNVDVLMVSPNESNPLTQIVEEAYNKGIPVVVLDRNINSNLYNVFIGGNNIMVGRLAGELSLNKLNEKNISQPNILTITGLEGSSPARDRYLGFMEIMAKQNITPKVLKADWNKDTAKKLLDSLNKVDYKNYDLIFAQNDEMARAASETYAGLDAKPIIIGVDGLATENGGLQMIINGHIDGTISYPPSGGKAVQAAFNLAIGKHVEKFNYEKIFKIDKSNALSLYNEALRVKEQQQKLKSLITNYDSLSLDIEEKNQVILWISILTGLLFVSVWVSLYTTKQKQKVNRLLLNKQTVINQQNKEIASNRDQLISALKQMEEMGERKSQFFSNISHEFKNLIALMSLDLEKVESDDNTKSRLKRYLSMINSNLNRLLSFKNLDTYDYPIEFKFGDIGMKLNQITENFKIAIQAKNLEFEYKPKRIFAEYDSDALDKIISNLLSNAIKYTNKGKIMVGIEELNDTIKITVKDTGIGIPVEDQVKIFDRHQRALTNNEDTQSYGIGLNFCKSLTILMNGDLVVNSELGKGSTFTITLPKNQYLERRKEKTTINSDKTKPTIIVAEDNSRIRLRIEQILENYYNVITANNGLEAYKLINYHQPDLVVSDILMPGLDGIELSQKLFNNPATIHIPIILLTAIQGEGIRIKGYETGADAFLTKPFSSETLLARIENLIQKHKNSKKNLLVSKEVHSRSNVDEKFIKEVNNYLLDRVSDNNFKIEDILPHLGMSRSKFYRKLKELTGMSPVEYFRKLRLDYSVQILLKSNFSISEISYKVGFSDIKYFTKIFQKEYKMTPSEYREMYSA